MANKRKTNPKFQTGMTEIPPFFGLGRSHITLQIKQNGKIFGRIEIYDGSIKWTPAKKKTMYYIKNWEQFRNLMESE